MNYSVCGIAQTNVEFVFKKIRLMNSTAGNRVCLSISRKNFVFYEFPEFDIDIKTSCIFCLRRKFFHAFY
jgi:hypothetical protein